MGFSSGVLLYAIVVGLAGIGVIEATDRPRVLCGRLAGLWAASLIGGPAAFAVFLGIDRFALAHFAYLLVVVTLPMWGGGLLAMRWVVDRTHRVALGLIAAAMILPAIFGYFATHVAPNRLRIDRVALELDDSVAIRIGVFADLQTPNVGEHEWNAVNELLAEAPDVVLVPGDLWQTSDAAIEEDWVKFREVLDALAAEVDHVFVVEGDTDDVGWLRVATNASNVSLLHNELTAFDWHGKSVAIAGMGPAPGSGYSPQQQAVLADLDALDADLSVVLAHRPDVVFAVSDKVDLVVSGHTHGGQVSLPFLGPLVTNTGVPKSVAKGGLHDYDGHAIYVSTGIGIERGLAPQVRFGVQPSVGVIDVGGPGAS